MLVSTTEELYAAVAAATSKATGDTCWWASPKQTPAALAGGAVNEAVKTGTTYQLNAVHCPTATVILLAPGARIELTGTPLYLPYGYALEIRGLGPAGATIDAKGLSRIFTVGGARDGASYSYFYSYEDDDEDYDEAFEEGGASLELHNVHLANGEAPEGGAVALYGNIPLGDEGNTKAATLAMYGGSIRLSKAVGGAEGSPTDGGGGAVLLQGSGDLGADVMGDVRSGLFLYRTSIVGCEALTDGGGLLVTSAPFRLVDVSVSGCSAGRYGGGVSSAMSTPSKVVGGSFSGCTAATGGGGYHQQEGTVGISGGATWEGCTTTNKATTMGFFETEVMGGGLLITDRANLNRADVTIRGSRGGNLNLRGDSQLVMARTLIEGGVGKWGAGLGMVGGEAKVSDSTIRGTDAGKFNGGGGAYLASGARLTCDRCRIVENAGMYGGGMVVEGGATATVRDSIIANNGGASGQHNGGMAGPRPTPRGGCLFGGGFVAWQGATLTIVHSEVEANTCRYGGGIQVALASTLVVRESKLTRNYAEWDGGAIGLGDLAFMVESVAGATVLAQFADPPKVQLLDVQIEHECNMGRYFPFDHADNAGPTRLGAGAVARHHPGLQLRHRALARLPMERILHPPGGGRP